LDAVVSYRSVPRILKLLDTKTDVTAGWIPHFTSVINWTLRLGLGLLKQVAPRSEPWAAIMDHSIDIGTKKVLVVLRIPLDTLSHKKAAITLNDCECIGLSVSETVKGESVSRDLERIFTQAGNPSVIIKDCDATLQKGVRLYAKKREIDLPVVDDIGHVVARALQAEYEKSADYTTFVSLLGKGANRLRQTALAFLVPPKLRVKGRFQSIGKLGKWGQKMLQTLDFIGPAENNSPLEKLRNVFTELPKLTGFINDFAHTSQVTSSLMKCLKNEGLNLNTYRHCHQLLEDLPKHSKVKIRLHDWLQTHQPIQQQFPSTALPVSSDIIESLFGRFKHVIERSPQADMNRTTLLIPALCGERDEQSIMSTLKQVPHAELKQWDENNIPYTLRRQRQYYLANDIIHIVGK
jgi:hypothetical protein